MFLSVFGGVFGPPLQPRLLQSCPYATRVCYIPIPITSIQKKCLFYLNSLLRFIKDPQKYHFFHFLAVFRPPCGQKVAIWSYKPKFMF